MHPIRILDQSLALLTLPYRLWRRRREQWLAPDALERLRNRRVVRLLRAARAAPYYARCFKEAGVRSGRDLTPDLLQRLPLLDKSTLRSLPVSQFLTVGERRLLKVSTSGSTGHPVTYLRSPFEEADFSARWWRVYAAYGCSGRASQVNIASGPKKDRSGPIAVLRQLGVAPRVAHLPATAPPAEHLRAIQTAKPNFLAGYAGAVETLADHLLDSRTYVNPLRVVICAGMEVTERCRRVAERAFRSPVANVYVTNELGVIAWACPENPDALHVNEDAFVVEIVDDDGHAVPAGVEGELVVTPLVQRSMPLLRYRIGDRAMRLAAPCSCGRGLGLMSPVQGRTAHVIRHPSGLTLSAPSVGVAITNAEGYEWMRRFQLRDEGGGCLRLLVEIKRPPTVLEEERLLGGLRAIVGDAYRVTLEVTSAIAAAPSGKFQFIVPQAPSATDQAAARPPGPHFRRVSLP